MKRPKEVKYLIELTSAVMTTAVLLDELFPLLEREDARYLRCELAKRAVQILNSLEQTNDSARYFGLGINYRTDTLRKRRHKEKVLAKYGVEGIHSTLPASRKP